MTTQTITDTTPWGQPHTPEPTRLQACSGCQWLVCNAAETADGVGWCQLSGQCRAVHIERECAEFRTRKTED